MTFNSRWTFILFLLVWVVGGNILAYLAGWHVTMPFGYCQGFGC